LRVAAGMALKGNCARYPHNGIQTIGDDSTMHHASTSKTIEKGTVKIPLRSHGVWQDAYKCTGFYKQAQPNCGVSEGCAQRRVCAILGALITSSVVCAWRKDVCRMVGGV